MDIADLLQRLQESGLSQTAIASAIGCSQSTISDMARAKIGKVRPSYRIVDGLIKLAAEQGISEDSGAPEKDTQSASDAVPIGGSTGQQERP